MDYLVPRSIMLKTTVAVWSNMDFVSTYKIKLLLVEVVLVLHVLLIRCMF